MMMQKNIRAYLMLIIFFTMPLLSDAVDLCTQIENDVKRNNEVEFISYYQDDFRGKNPIGALKWMIGGEGIRSLRSYWLHVPPDYSGSTPVPLVIVLHGATVFNAYNPFWFFTNSLMESYSGMSEKADQEGFIAVYPNAKLLFDKENAEGLFAYYVDFYPENWLVGHSLVDDEGFIWDLIERMQEEYNIDQKRIYLTGFSNGADLAYYLAAKFSDSIAASAPVAGSIGAKNEGDQIYRIIPEPINPVSVIVFHGTNDSLLPYERSNTRTSVNESVSFWVNANGCDPEPSMYQSESGKIIRRTYENGNGGTEVISYTTAGGNHWWPGNNWGPKYEWLHDSIQEISATDLIWDFFEEHEKQ